MGGVFHFFYYRRFRILGRKNIPPGAPVIFAAIHQNALMDALAVIFASRRQIVFLARADIFKKKSIARLLRFLRILPVYRFRDGYQSIIQNQDTFDEVSEVLQRRIPVGIFPEGMHAGRKTLKPFRKGIARIAFQAEAKAGFNLGLQIVPVGLDYSDYFHAGHDLLVIFGKPLHVSTYRELYHQNPANAVNKLLSDLADATRLVMIDIRPEEVHDIIHPATEIILAQKYDRNRFFFDQKAFFEEKKRISGKLCNNFEGNEETFRELGLILEHYRAKQRQYRLNDHAKPMSTGQLPVLILHCAFSILFFPLYLYGLILNYLPYGLPQLLSRKIKDQPLAASVNFGARFLMSIFWYILLSIIISFIFSNIFLILLIILSVPLSGLFAFYYSRDLLNLEAQCRLLFLKIFRKKIYRELCGLKVRIIAKTEVLMTE